jgi:hypothetical protein
MVTRRGGIARRRVLGEEVQDRRIERSVASNGVPYRAERIASAALRHPGLMLAC